jgi:RNA polymerase sigma-70 factor, ECF subfamily
VESGVVATGMTDEQASEAIRQQVDAIYRAESRRIFATLIRLLGDFDLAEDALQDAFRAAMEQWPRDGLPANPRAWLVSTGRFKAIDQLRRRNRFETSLGPLAEEVMSGSSEATEVDNIGLDDDPLRLIFTCCHPALRPEARMAHHRSNRFAPGSHL